MVNFENLKYFEYPYKHLVIDDFFNDAQIYKKIWNEDGERNFEFDLDKFKNEFNEKVFPLLLDKIEEHFGEVDRDSFIEDIYPKNDRWDDQNMIDNPKDYNEFLIGRPSHIDGDSKKYPMLIYFDDGSAEEGIPEHAGSFQLMNWKNPEEVLKTVDFKNNRAVLFEASSISFHKYWTRPKNRLNLNIPIVNNKNNHELTEHYKNQE